MSTSLLNEQQKLAGDLKIVAELENGLLPLRSIENRARQFQSEYMAELITGSFASVGKFLREYFVRSPIHPLTPANDKHHDSEHPAAA